MGGMEVGICEVGRCVVRCGRGCEVRARSEGV